MGEPPGITHHQQPTTATTTTPTTTPLDPWDRQSQDSRPVNTTQLKHQTTSSEQTQLLYTFCTLASTNRNSFHKTQQHTNTMPAGTPRLSMFKSVSRYMTEPHPFARNPVTVKPAPIAWNALARHMGRTGKSYVTLLPLNQRIIHILKTSTVWSPSSPSSWAGPSPWPRSSTRPSACDSLKTRSRALLSSLRFSRPNNDGVMGMRLRS